MKNKMNKNGDISQMILIIGTVLVCILTLLSFNLTNVKIRDSFVGLGLVEQLNSQIEENYFYETTTGTGKVTEGSTIERDITNAIEYAKNNNVVDRKCNCGDKCDEYASALAKSSSESGISDSILLLALMMQESSCSSDAFSGSSIGLMQINLDNCGAYGLPSDKTECKKELIDNPEKNIEVGAKILKEKYNAYGKGKEFNGCDKVKDYEGWDAALRGYNGWGCGCDTLVTSLIPKNICEVKNEATGEIKSGTKISAQDNFVEEVTKRYDILKGNYLEKETTTGILWWIKKTISFSVEYKGSP
jgi:hypothetical protein